jgi:CheY-like chemotaxis protein
LRHAAGSYILGQKKMLLIVDDDPAFLESADESLNDGRGVLFANNGQRARQLLDAIGPGCSVLMIDLDMPGEDGFSLIREMRRKYPALPIIAISGVYQTNVLESAKLLGARDTLQKPITPEWRATIARVRQARG